MDVDLSDTIAGPEEPPPVTDSDPWWDSNLAGVAFVIVLALATVILEVAR